MRRKLLTGSTLCLTIGRGLGVGGIGKSKALRMNMSVYEAEWLRRLNGE